MSEPVREPRAESLRAAFARWQKLGIYERFEQAVILLLTGLIAIVVLGAVWNLIVRIGGSLLSPHILDPTEPAVFQALFGAIFTVIIALEFKRSLLVAAERKFGVVQVRVVVLIAMLAVVRKFIILDLAATEAEKLVGLAAAILALGVVYWLVCDQDRRDQASRRAASGATPPPQRGGQPSE